MGLTAQASPIVVMIVASVIVVLGLGLVSYVVSLMAAQQARISLQDFIYDLQTSTLAYVEYAEPDLSRVYVGLLNYRGGPVTYYLLVLPADGNASAVSLTVALRDPARGTLAPVSVPCARVHVFARGFMPVSDYYAGAGLTTCQLYPVRFLPEGRPYMVEIGVAWASGLEPLPLNVFVLVGVGGDYYEVARLVVRPQA